MNIKNYDLIIHVDSLEIHSYNKSTTGPQAFAPPSECEKTTIDEAGSQ